MALKLPGRVFLDVHDEATVCPVLVDPPLSLMEQMQRSGFELVGRDTGDIVVHTPQTDGEGSGSALATFFEHFPQLFQVLDQESIGKFAPFLDEETVGALERRATEAQAAALVDEVDVPPASMGLPRRMSASDSLEDSLDTMKQILNNSVMTAEAAIERQQRNYREELHKMQAEQGQLEAERQDLERDRAMLVQKEAQLQSELEEVDNLRSQIEVANTRPKSKFLCC